MMSVEQDHYGVLELKPCSPMEDVKSHYRRLAKLYHPDLHGDDAQCAEQFRRVNAAYTFLSDAPRKAAYDAVLQAARRAGAPPFRPAPPKSMPPKSPPSAVRGRQASVTAAGSREAAGDTLRMTRSAWLGATAGAVVVMLVIGLSLDGLGPRRPAAGGGSTPVSIGSAPGVSPDNRREAGPEPGADADPAAGSDPAAASPDVSSAAPPADAAPAPRLRVPLSAAPFDATTRPGFVSGAWTVPTAPSTTPADPTDTLKHRLLARYHAALPRADRLLGRGYVVRAAGPEPEDGSRRILREQLAADLANLSAARARLRPDLARLSRRDTPERSQRFQREAGPILADMERLDDAGKPVRDDIKALAAAPAVPRPPRVAFHFAPLVPTRAASPTQAAMPTRATSDVSPPTPLPNPTTVSAVSSPPRVPDRPAADLAVKPKAQAASGQEFIPWASQR